MEQPYSTRPVFRVSQERPPDPFKESVINLARFAFRKYVCIWNHAGFGEPLDYCQAILSSFIAYEKHILNHCKRSQKSSLDIWHCGLPRCNWTRHLSLEDLENHVRQSHIQRLPLNCPAISCNEAVRHHDSLPEHYIQCHGRDQITRISENRPSVRSGPPPLTPDKLTLAWPVMVPTYEVQCQFIKPGKPMTKHFAGSKPPATPRRRLPSRLSTTPRTRDDDDGQEFLEYCKFQPPVKSLFSEESISNQSESRIRVKVSRRSAGLEPWAPPVGRRNFAATKWNRKVPGEVATTRSTADFCWESYSTLVINNPEPGPLKRSIGFMGLYETWKKTPEGMEALKKQRVCYRQPGEKE